jgi:hypothetical protein
MVEQNGSAKAKPLTMHNKTLMGDGCGKATAKLESPSLAATAGGQGCRER